MPDPSVYAIVRDSDGLVLNVVLWDGEAQWSPPAGTTAVPDATSPDQQAVIGGTYSTETGFSLPE